MRTKMMCAFVCVLAVLLGQTASAALNDFRGTWVNVDPNTGGLTKLVITAAATPVDDPAVSVHAWGQCTPSDCDWGVVKAHAYCPSVGSNMVATARAIVAVYKTSFSEVTLVMRRSGTRLVVQTLTRFTDNSNRRNYDATYTFRRHMIPLVEFEVPFEPKVPPQLLRERR